MQMQMQVLCDCEMSDKGTDAKPLAGESTSGDAVADIPPNFARQGREGWAAQ